MRTLRELSQYFKYQDILENTFMELNMKDIQKLKDKVAIVTGGGTGIGRSIVLGFAAEGAKLAVCGRTLSSLEQVSREVRDIGAQVTAIRADVTVESEVENMVEQTLKAFGKIDILVNNAGLPGPQGLITEISKKVWDEIMNINVTGLFLCSRAVLKHMMTRSQGNIINISSGAGRTGSKIGIRSLPYNVSKFSAEGFTYALAKQMKPYGICVNAMRPGIIDTAFHKDSPPEFRAQMSHADKVKPLAVFLALQTVDTMTGESIDLHEWENSLKIT
jgi:NAD(P)-dependent dehydrogenase (short-subunit alcohol dehydrogenase family)